MNKKLIVALAAAAATASYAQSSVTLTGNIDAAVRHATGSIGNTTSLGSGGISGSRIHFRGIEDLGGGMSASFWLEAQFDASNGAGLGTNTNNQASGNAPAGQTGIIFNRRSTVSLAGSWGELRLGRDYTPQFWNVNAMDPFQTNGIGASNVLLYGQGGNVAARASNSIGYHSPGRTGFYGQGMVFFGENNQNGAATEDDGNGWSTRLGHRGSAHDFAIAHGKSNYAAGDVTTTNLGAKYDFGALTLTGTYQTDRVATGRGKGYLVGLQYDIGAGTIRASYSTYKRALPGNPEAGKFALGYVHNLSKRTALYGTVAHLKNKGTATLALADAVTGPGQKSSGIELGIRHLF